MIYRIFLSAILGLILTSDLNAANTLDSPDGNLSVFVENGCPFYNINYKDQRYLGPSPLGLKTNVGDFSSGLVLEDVSDQKKISEYYEIPNIKQSKVQYDANEGAYAFIKGGNKAMDVIFRISNNNIAFKYKIYPQGENRSCIIFEETTRYQFFEGTTTFLCPQSLPMRGFARSSPSYKTSYIADGKLYEDILFDANDYGLMLIFHGCTLPRGWERMFPNYASSEAVLASENLHFNQGNCDIEAFNGSLHPFIRNTVGSMDFGGSALNKYYHIDNSPKRGNHRRTSDVFALSTAVLFQSPVQHFALVPNNLNDAPDWAINFMKEVPSTWDEIRFFEGYPGKYVVLARRNGDRWHIAGINAQDETLNLDIKLPMIEKDSKLIVYKDAPD